MLLAPGGAKAGMISGGCLDGDIRERAMRVLALGMAEVVTYDSSSPDDIIFGLGLGCNGVVQVLLEPVRVGDPSGMLAFLAACRDARRAGRVATLFHNGSPPPGVPNGTRLMIWPDGRMSANFKDDALGSTLLAAMRDTEGRRHAIRTLRLPGGEKAGALLETIAPPPSLLLFGGGDDAIPVTQIASLLGWHVTVVDARPEFAQHSRFPQADDVLCLRPGAVRDDPRLAITPETLVMIMTHSYSRDKELLKLLLARSPRYIGALGPKTRTQNLLDELARDGVRFTPDQLECLHGPAGLDIGAETPEEIAVSIIAEMQAALIKRPGGPLRNKAGGIHESVEPPLVPA
jgi:xanthine/CO dehydrogenase XdhC/CoxF family maturation factor